MLRRRALRTALCFGSLQTSLHKRHMPRPQCGPSTRPFCDRLACVEAAIKYYALLCDVTDLVPWPSHALLQTPARARDPRLCTAWLAPELRRRTLRTALCFASLQTSIHSRYIPCCRPNPVTPALASDPHRLALRRQLQILS